MATKLSKDVDSEKIGVDDGNNHVLAFDHIPHYSDEHCILGDGGGHVVPMSVDVGSGVVAAVVVVVGDNEHGNHNSLNVHYDNFELVAVNMDKHIVGGWQMIDLRSNNEARDSDLFDMARSYDDCNVYHLFPHLDHWKRRNECRDVDCKCFSIRNVLHIESISFPVSLARDHLILISIPVFFEVHHVLLFLLVSGIDPNKRNSHQVL